MADRDERYPDGYFPVHRDGYDLNTRIMLTAIISLSVVVVLVIALHLYVRCVLRRQAQRRTFIRQLAIGAAAQVHSSEPPKTGLDPSVIATLPTFVFRRGKCDDDSGSTECPVCLGAVEDGETARLLPNCKHSFHMACIDKWLSSQSTCPVCRADAQPRKPPEAAPATAPPLEQVNSAVVSVEGTSEGEVGPGPSAKVTGSTSRLSSFRRMLSRERSSRRNQSCGQEDGVEEFERV